MELKSAHFHFQMHYYAIPKKCCKSDINNHPSIFFHLSESWRLPAKAENPTPPPPWPLNPVYPGELQHVSWSWDMPATPHPGCILVICPNHLNWLLSVWKRAAIP